MYLHVIQISKNDEEITFCSEHYVKEGFDLKRKKAKSSSGNRAKKANK